MKTVYTYYEPIDEQRIETAPTMLEHWRRSWASQGWNPVVLNESHAKTHPLYESYLRRTSELPTVNPPVYERSCYLRWLAVAQVGGGFMSDYDVVNYNWPARDIAGHMILYEVHPQLELATPSVVGGSQAGFQNVCTAMCSVSADQAQTLINDKVHVSDMLILQYFAATGLYAATRTVRQYGEEGWEYAPLVHYSYNSTESTDRVTCMKTARSL